MDLGHFLKNRTSFVQPGTFWFVPMHLTQNTFTRMDFKGSLISINCWLVQPHTQRM